MKDKPSLIAVLKEEGIELKRKGYSYWALCPFHPEKTPSLKVNPAAQRFYCFGCHEHGDVIDFIKLYKGLDFIGAIKYLGINGDIPSKEDTLKKQTKQALLQAFRQWEISRHSELCMLYRCFQRAKAIVRNEADLDKIADFYHRETQWQFELEVLESQDDKRKFEMFKREVKGNERI